MQRATAYAVSMVLGGTAMGIAFATAGAGLSALWDSAMVPLSLVLGAIALAYAFHEVGLVQLPVPGRGWQVPVEWVQHGFYKSAAIFGGTVGLGVFTRVPYASLPILLAWLFVAGDVLYGVIAGLVYGVARAASIYSSRDVAGPEQLVELNERIMSYAPSLHQLTGIVLAAFAAYLLIAPTLP